MRCVSGGRRERADGRNLVASCHNSLEVVGGHGLPEGRGDVSRELGVACRRDVEDRRLVGYDKGVLVVIADDVEPTFNFCQVSWTFPSPASTSSPEWGYSSPSATQSSMSRTTLLSHSQMESNFATTS